MTNDSAEAEEGAASIAAKVPTKKGAKNRIHLDSWTVSANNSFKQVHPPLSELRLLVIY